MGLEKRNGHVYYYKSRRDGEKVRKVYVGAGDFAHVAAELDEAKRRQREEEAAYWREERERLEALDSLMEELCEAAEVLAKAALLAADYHQHKRGEWRKRRDRQIL